MEQFDNLTQGFPVVHPNQHNIDSFNISSFIFPPLFIQDKRNKVRIWQGGYSEQSNEMLVIAGLESSTRLYISEVEKKGKRNNSQQAFQILKKQYNDKINGGYTDDIEEKESLIIKRPMLAVNYTVSNVNSFPVIIQPKLDGTRLITYIENGKVMMLSRNLKSYDYSDDHFVEIKKELIKLFDILPEGSQLDGELYSHELEFTDICSVLRTRKTVHPDINKIKYVVFDIVEAGNLNYEDRFEILIEACDKINTKFVKIISFEIANSHEEIDVFMNEYLKQGYEGLMIKKIGQGTEYVEGRSPNVLKYKLELEEEITVTDIIECKGNEKELCKIVGVRDSGEEVTVRPSCNFEERRNMLINKDNFIGKRYTIIFNEINPKTGVPRFPRGKEFRDYE